MQVLHCARLFLLVVAASLQFVVGAEGQRGPKEDIVRPTRYLTFPEFLAEIVAMRKGKPLRRGVRSSPESREAFRYLLEHNVLTAWGDVKKFDGFRTEEEQYWASKYLDEIAKKGLRK